MSVKQLSTIKVTCRPKPKDALLLGTVCIVANIYMNALAYGYRAFVFGISWNSFVAHLHHVHFLQVS